MNYCPKEVTANDVLNNMSDDDIEFTLASCEMTCDRYYRCDTACLMQDRLKELQDE